VVLTVTRYWKSIPKQDGIIRYAFNFPKWVVPSKAVPVRQVSLLFGVLIGVFLLGESCGRIRFFAASLVLAGVFLIRLG
jgi:drug/metabolite transporter (DMT)-like permease